MRDFVEDCAVDPKVIAEQTGISPAPESGENGADYLRRMKEQTSSPPLAGPAVAPASAVPVTAYKGRERRRSTRFRCAGSAEFSVEGSDVRMWGTLSDVSLHGCYVEMNNTFPVDTRVRLALEANGVRTEMRAVIRVTYPFLGMGICFSEIEPAQQSQLEQMLAALSGIISPNSSFSKSPAPVRSLAGVDAAALLDKIAAFFRGNALLSRKEFYELADRTRR